MWGASAQTEEFIHNRRADPPEQKTEIHVHHTAAMDLDDDTPNRWDYNEAERYMQRLQWARPDLGPLPYSENVAVSEDLETAWVFEGRGILTRGAHTGGHNVPGVGWGVFGNFDVGDADAAGVAVTAIEMQASTYKQSITPNLGSIPNPHGWVAWGHRDSSSKTCPGHHLYPLLALFSLEEELAILSDEAQQFYEDNYRNAKRNLNPMTNEDFLEYAVLHIRAEAHDKGLTVDEIVDDIRRRLES